MNEQQLIDKLRRIEALFAGAATTGERDAAAAARTRIEERLRSVEADDPPIEMRFGLADPWQRQLFLALARRYALRPYRYPGQHRSTVMLRAPRRFLDETLWPEFQQLAEVLRGYLDEVTRRVLATVVHEDTSEASESNSPPALTSGR
jgi:hypothetical protein